MENPTTDYRRFFIEDTNMYNHIVLGNLLPQYLWVPLPRFFQTWLRNYVAAVVLYFISGFLWSFYIYYWKRNVYLPKGSFIYSYFFDKIYLFICLFFYYHNLCFLIDLLLKMVFFFFVLV